MGLLGELEASLCKERVGLLGDPQGSQIKERAGVWAGAV